MENTVTIQAIDGNVIVIPGKSQVTYFGVQVQMINKDSGEFCYVNLSDQAIDQLIEALIEAKKS